jgi:hypothetical protein
MNGGGSFVSEAACESLYVCPPIIFFGARVSSVDCLRHGRVRSNIMMSNKQVLVVDHDDDDESKDRDSISYIIVSVF